MLNPAVVVPTFNEKLNVGALIARLESVLEGLRWEIVFVDDDSPDGTADSLGALGQVKPHMRCVQRLGRRGLSRAVVEGMPSTSAPVFAVMDADLQHDETLLPAMLAKLADEQLDVVVGSRYAAGGSVGEWSTDRVRLSQLATRLAHAVVGADLSAIL